MNDIIINDIDKVEIKYDIKKGTNYFISSIIPYNVSSSTPLHKPWILVERAKVNILNTDNITFMFSNSNDSYISICNLENKILSQLSTDLGFNITSQSKVNKNGLYPSFEANYDTDKIEIYDANNSSVVSEIKYLEYDIIVELSSVILSYNKCHFNWSIVQLKENIFIQKNHSIFSKLSNSKPHNLVVHQNINLPHPPPLPPNIPIVKPNNNVIKHQPLQLSSNISSGFIPSVSDLLNAKSLLKKPNDKSKTSELDKIKINLPNSINLKPTITKETSFIEILKHENNTKIIEDLYPIINNSILYKRILLLNLKISCRMIKRLKKLE